MNTLKTLCCVLVLAIVGTGCIAVTNMDTERRDKGGVIERNKSREFRAGLGPIGSALHAPAPVVALPMYHANYGYPVPPPTYVPAYGYGPGYGGGSVGIGFGPYYSQGPTHGGYHHRPSVGVRFGP